MNGRAWKWALFSAPMALSVSACMGWGGYPPAKDVHASQLIGTWHAADCKATLTLGRDGSASATGIPTEADLNGKVTHRISGDGTWEIDKSGTDVELEVTIRNEGTPFALYRNDKHLLVALTIGDPDDMNSCLLSREPKSAADAPTAALQ